MKLCSAAERITPTPFHKYVSVKLIIEERASGRKNHRGHTGFGGVGESSWHLSAATANLKFKLHFRPGQKEQVIEITLPDPHTHKTKVEVKHSSLRPSRFRWQTDFEISKTRGADVFGVRAHSRAGSGQLRFSQADKLSKCEPKKLPS